MLPATYYWVSCHSKTSMSSGWYYSVLKTPAHHQPVCLYTWLCHGLLSVLRDCQISHFCTIALLLTVAGYLRMKSNYSAHNNEMYWRKVLQLWPVLHPYPPIRNSPTESPFVALSLPGYLPGIARFSLFFSSIRRRLICAASYISGYDELKFPFSGQS